MPSDKEPNTFHRQNRIRHPTEDSPESHAITPSEISFIHSGYPRNSAAFEPPSNRRTSKNITKLIEAF